MTTVHDICLDADTFRAAYPSWPSPEPEATPCRICGKAPSAPHDAATRSAHLDHLTRLGWSGMCPAPRSQASEAVRASCAAAGITAESPDHLHPEAELIAITERWTDA